MIVTFNLKHYPPEYLLKYGLHAVSPDDFLLDLWDLNQESVLEALHSKAQRTNNPTLAFSDVVQSLIKTTPKFRETVMGANPR